jgi:hypothetical protein
MITMESHDGATPNGGVRSEIYFFDNSGRPTTKEKAVRFTVRELDKDRNVILETQAVKSV